jgi:hypothetical protein
LLQINISTFLLDAYTGPAAGPLFAAAKGPAVLNTKKTNPNPKKLFKKLFKKLKKITRVGIENTRVFCEANALPTELFRSLQKYHSLNALTKPSCY